MRFIAYRNLVGVAYTENEAKAEAAEVMVRISTETTPKITFYCIFISLLLTYLLRYLMISGN